MRLYDAHNHLHDDRFAGKQSDLVAECLRSGVAQMVVDGGAEQDWPQLAALAKQYPQFIIPSFGYHPWYVGERTPQWLQVLTQFLDDTPHAVIGEIGLDRWKPDLPYEGQEEVFLAQLSLAAQRNLPASIHCLQTWGRLYDLLRKGPRPARGFLLHSYGGPREMVAPLAELGAYFSFPGYFMNERKSRQREAFAAVPADRLLIETDAPDQLLPVEQNAHPLTDPASGKPLNHPANLEAIYCFVAGMLNEPLEPFAKRVEQNFLRLFG